MQWQYMRRENYKFLVFKHSNESILAPVHVINKFLEKPHVSVWETYCECLKNVALLKLQVDPVTVGCSERNRARCGENSAPYFPNILATVEIVYMC